MKTLKACSHSSVDPSAPTILQPWVRIPTQHLCFFNLHINSGVKRTKLNKKRPEWPIFNKRYRYYVSYQRRPLYLPISDWRSTKCFKYIRSIVSYYVLDIKRFYCISIVGFCLPSQKVPFDRSPTMRQDKTKSFNNDTNRWNIEMLLSRTEQVSLGDSVQMLRLVM